jgi:hypothetical protein
MPSRSTPYGIVGIGGSRRDPPRPRKLPSRARRRPPEPSWSPGPGRPERSPALPIGRRHLGDGLHSMSRSGKSERSERSEERERTATLSFLGPQALEEPGPGRVSQPKVHPQDSRPLPPAGHHWKKLRRGSRADPGGEPSAGEHPRRWTQLGQASAAAEDGRRRAVSPPPRAGAPVDGRVKGASVRESVCVARGRSRRAHRSAARASGIADSSGVSPNVVIARTSETQSRAGSRQRPTETVLVRNGWVMARTD